MIRGSNPVGVMGFRTLPERHWGPPNLLHNGYRICLVVNRAGCSSVHPHPTSADVEGRVELHIYSTSGFSWSVLGWTFTFYTIGLYSELLTASQKNPQSTPTVTFWKTWNTSFVIRLRTGTSGVQIPGKAWGFPHLQNVQTGPGVHQTFCLVGLVVIPLD